MILSQPDMRSRAARWTFVAMTLIASAAAAYFLFTTQKTITTDAAALRAVDLYAREAGDALADLRAGQQAYVAAGQGVAFWMPKVAATSDAAAAALKALGEAAASPEARAAAAQASAALAEFTDVDKRARDYVHAGQTLMASDVIFTEGGQLAAVAARQAETARQTEHQAFDAAEAALRRQQTAVFAGAAAIVGLMALLLGATGSAARDTGDEVQEVRLNRVVPAASDDGIVSHAKAAPPSPGPPAALARNSIVLRATASLATDFGRLRDADELSRLLERTADLIDATGLIVWMGNASGSDLRPVLSHGYTPQMLARMTSMPRTADNAAAAAYRSGTLQIVLSKPGGSRVSGAVVAPILGVEGCIGALSAEIKNGGEGSEAVQAVTAIIAAHLAGVMAAAPAEAEALAAEPKAAQA